MAAIDIGKFHSDKYFRTDKNPTENDCNAFSPTLEGEKVKKKYTVQKLRPMHIFISLHKTYT